jgi:TusA-related sulfurtransferase
MKDTMSECLFGENEREMRDLRNETCTNLTIQLSLLMKSMKPGEKRRIIVTPKQYIQIEEIPDRFHIKITKEICRDDLLITLQK